MSGLVHATLVFLFFFTGVSLNAGKIVLSPEDYDEIKSMNEVLVRECLYTSVSIRAVSMYSEALLHPDYDLFTNLLDRMTLNNYQIEIEKRHVKANLEAIPITFFRNLQIHYYKAVKLGEFFTSFAFEKYTQHLRNSSSPPQDLDQVEPYSLNPAMWTIPWIKEELVKGLRHIAKGLERFAGRNLNDQEEMWIKSNSSDNILEIIGQLGNDIVRSNFVLEKLNYFKSNIFQNRGDFFELKMLLTFLEEEDINAIVDCWYDPDRFSERDAVDSELGGNLLLLNAMIEGVPEDRVKEVLISWRKTLLNLEDLENLPEEVEAALNNTIQVIHEKVKEFDMARIIALVKVRVENLVGDMLGDIDEGGNLLERVKNLNEMMEKAVWRMKSGLWPEMVNLVDRLLLGLKRKEFNGTDLLFWKNLDNLLSPTYHTIKTEYQAELIKELFPASKLKVGAGWHDFWTYLNVQFGIPDLGGQGKLNTLLYNMFANPQYDTLTEIESYVRRMDAVEWEKWMLEKLYGYSWHLIRNQIMFYTYKGVDNEMARGTLRDVLEKLRGKGVTDGLFMDDWEKIPVDLEDFMEIDWETYFVYFLHMSLETGNFDVYARTGLMAFIMKSHHDHF